MKKKESVNVTPYWAVLVANFFLLFKPKKVRLLSRQRIHLIYISCLYCVEVIFSDALQPEPDDDAYFAKFYGLMDDIDVSKIEPLTKGPPGFSMVVKGE